MSTSNNAFDESTYFIEAENAAEMARLTTQDRMATKSMGGVFPEQADLSTIHDILDIACGPGGWVLDVAQMYPDKQVTGVDISRLMVEYAKAQAREKDLGNAHFQVMDALKTLDFPDNSFDLVNARFIAAFMPKNAWPRLVQEAMRISRPGGIIRLTEFESAITNSPAVERLTLMLARSMWLAGQSFSPDGQHTNTTMMLPRFLREAGCVNIQKMAHLIDFSTGMEAHRSTYQNTMVLFKLLQPFFVKTGVATQEELNQLYPRAMEEMMSESYCGLIFFLTAWGHKPL